MKEFTLAIALHHVMLHMLPMNELAYSFFFLAFYFYFLILFYF